MRGLVSWFEHLRHLEMGFKFDKNCEVCCLVYDVYQPISNQPWYVRSLDDDTRSDIIFHNEAVKSGVKRISFSEIKEPLNNDRKHAAGRSIAASTGL